MIMSMTGFACYSVPLVEQGNEHCSLEIEIKTFNSRFFEPSCKLPSSLSSYEMDVVQRLKKRILRGRVYCTVRINGNNALLEKLLFSDSRVEDYLAIAKKMREQHTVQGELTVAQMISLPGIFSTERVAFSEEAAARFLDGVDAALELLVTSRTHEGKQLEVDLKQRFSHAAQLMAEIEQASKQRIVSAKQEIAALAAKAQAGDEEARSLLSDRYTALDKMDVHEEIVRFLSHIKAVHKHLDASSPEKGRRLDFILQELMRETNTITAKCTSYDISALAVDVKVELEKAREQVQNIV